MPGFLDLEGLLSVGELVIPESISSKYFHKWDTPNISTRCNYCSCRFVGDAAGKCINCGAPEELDNHRCNAILSYASLLSGTSDTGPR
jgi:hypothetical protein